MVDNFLSQHRDFLIVGLKTIKCYKRLLYYLSFYINFLILDL